ncbi:uncharacterized protein LOC121257215 [Juglans microcarpa x Juglans regia]|uniref:uncharacterized protein LOC121257215 n=1 Tax=Juglans microcarpa x Juglans regia TaxID=2249226 RepID=UPI001B7DCD36|nr:uncharacterized protein LOC121257215 [Juglans microcarpa x Juglans regia]
MAGESEGGCTDTNGEKVDETTSPKNRVKFLCSHGGRILPRPTDGQLKYVGGETRVIAIPRDISFSELMKKVVAVFDVDTILKYQALPEDLDALVSVRSDEDLKHMLEEYDRHESEATPRLRTFLFPSNPIMVDNQATYPEPHALEQRYVDAINGIIRTTTASTLTSINTNRVTFTISSACASPHCSSPKAQNVDPLYDTISSNGYRQNGLVSMHKVHSSPNLCSLNNFQNHSNGLGNHHLCQHHHYQNHVHQHHHGYYHSRPPIDPHNKGVGGEILARTLSSSRADIGRSLMGYRINNYYPSSRHRREGGGCNVCGYECGFYGCGGFEISGTRSIPRSPR